VVESTSETAYTIKPWPGYCSGYCSDTDAFSLCKTSITNQGTFHLSYRP